jgi:hypothetical protein
MVAKPAKLTPQTIEHVAHHEAGHFVAAYFQGAHEHIDGITIVPAGDAAGENTGQYPLDDDSSEREIWRVIVHLFAGHAAELQFDPARKAGARITARDDDEKAGVFLRQLREKKSEQNKLEARLRSLASSLIDEHWPSVAALAQELLEHRKLDVDEATWIVAVAEGERAKKELEYRRRRDALYATELRTLTKSTRRSK